MIHAKAVPVELGGQTRHLLYTLNAFALCKQRHGFNPLSLSDENMTDPVVLRALLWAGLVHEAPDLTVEDVGGWVSLHNFGYVTKAILDAYIAAKEPDTVADPLAPGVTAAP